MDHQIYDLIYAEEPKAKFAEAFTTAKIEDASDFVHEERFSILLPPEVTTMEYYKFLIRNHFGNVSLNFGLAVTQRSPELLEAWNQIKVERAQAKLEEEVRIVDDLIIERKVQ